MFHALVSLFLLKIFFLIFLIFSLLRKKHDLQRREKYRWRTPIGTTTTQARISCSLVVVVARLRRLVVVFASDSRVARRAATIAEDTRTTFVAEAFVADPEDSVSRGRTTTIDRRITINLKVRLCTFSIAPLIVDIENTRLDVQQASFVAGGNRGFRGGFRGGAHGVGLSFTSTVDCLIDCAFAWRRFSTVDCLMGWFFALAWLIDLIHGEETSFWIVKKYSNPTIYRRICLLHYVSTYQEQFWGQN